MIISGKCRRACRALLTAALIVISANAAMAESGSYRIEVLIFSHLDSTSEPQKMEEIRSFTEFPELGESLVPEAPIALDVTSSMMQDTWRRLRLSASYLPLLFASWEQSRIDYHPPVRLHDEELIAEQIHFPYEVAFIDLRSMNMFEHYLAPYYRLDGTVQLRRTRFLHLNLDLEYRQDLLPRTRSPEVNGAHGLAEIVVNSARLTNTSDPEYSDSELVEDILDPSPGPALVHTIEQSRQIRTGQMQYFDTPYLGVLVRVTATPGR